MVTLPTSLWNSITTWLMEASNRKLGLTKNWTGLASGAAGTWTGTAGRGGTGLSPEPWKGGLTWIDNWFDMMDDCMNATPGWRGEMFYRQSLKIVLMGPYDLTRAAAST